VTVYKTLVRSHYLTRSASSTSAASCDAIRQKAETTPGARHESDEALLERVQRTAFEYFRRNANPVNGLIADTTRPGAPSSIAVVGFALSTYPVGVERGGFHKLSVTAPSKNYSIRARPGYWSPK